MSEADPRSPSLPSRRDFLTMGLGVFLVATLPRAARPRSRLVRQSVPVMGTIADLAAVHPDPRYAYAALRAAAGELRAVEATMTRFDPRSDVGRANLAAAREPVVVSESTAAVLAAALGWAAATGGSFDPALGRATELWDVEHRSAPPPAFAFARLADRGLWRRIEMGRRAGHPVVAFDDPDVGIDLGGIAKGYGVDRAVATLRTWGITSALVNVGGDLYALGRSEDGDPWEIGIRSPADPSALSGVVRVENLAVATSGDYERYFDFAGRRYHHLLDPRTAAPRASRRHSLTVTADTCLAADAAATAGFGYPPAEAERLARAGDPGAAIVPA